MKSFFIEVYRSFVRVNGFLLSLVSLVTTLLVFLFPPSLSISIKILLPSGIAFLLVLIVLIDLSIRMYASNRILPPVKHGKTPPRFYPDAAALLVLDNSPLFSHDTLLSVYFNDDGYEILIGVGFVFNIQENGLIQAVITRIFGDQHGDVWDKVKANDGSILKRLIVKPSIPRQIEEK